MRLVLQARKRSISALMGLIAVQALITYVWFASRETDGSNALERTDSEKNKPKRQDVVPAVMNRLFIPTTGTQDLKIGNSLTLKGRTTTAVQFNPVLLSRKGPIRKVDVSGSKLLLHLYHTSKSYCSGNVDFYENMTIMMRNVTVDPSKGHTRARGGEKIKDVLLQEENAEFYRFDPGLFHVGNCSNIPEPKNFKFGHQLVRGSRINDAIEISKNPLRTKEDEILDYEGNFVITLTRFEYANVYWTVIDLYDTFLMMQLYNQTFQNTDLLILDAHPHTSLDGLFNGIFRRVFRLFDLEKRTRFRNLLLGFSRGKSPILLQVLRPLTLVDKFRKDVLTALGVPLNPEADRERRCQARSLNVLFIWRRNYVGHPRNPKGIVSRKISNEQELLRATRESFPDYHIHGEQLDKLPIPKQLLLIRNADIMVGMHGAAFGFTLFMQEGAGVLELWPRGQTGNWHMEYIAKRSGIYYQSWENTDAANENVNEKTTKVSADAVNRKVRELSIRVCSKYSQK